VELKKIFGCKMETLTGGWRKFQWHLGKWDLWCMRDISEKSKWSKKHFVWNSEGRILSPIKGIILEFILEVSAVGCHLDSSGSVKRLLDGTTVPARAMLCFRDSLISTQMDCSEFEQFTCSLLRSIIHWF
jgi:hypothetical protein